MKIAHLTTVDMSLRFLVLPQLESAASIGEAIGISAPGPYVRELEERGIRHIPLADSTRGVNVVSDVRAAYQLWKVLRREKIDVLHTHNPKPGVYGRVVGRLAGVPIVVNTVHGLYATEESSKIKRWLVYGLEWLAAKFSDAELIQNPEDLELMERLRIVSPSKMHLLGNGVDLNRFNPESAAKLRDAAREELGLDNDQIVVGMIGRLVAEKGVPELLQAFAGLDSRFVLVVAGPDDPDKSDSLPRSLITDAEAAGVRFLGMRHDVERLYAAFDLFVLPSHREGFPRAAMEAAASGLPVVATQIRGCRQVVDHGVNGLLVPVGDLHALRGAITDVGGDQERLASFSKASARIAEKRFDESRVVEIVMSTYRDLAADKGLRWLIPSAPMPTRIRLAELADARTLGEMHVRLISSGFLSSLGAGFLTLLYRELIRDDRSVVLVAENDSSPVGFIAATEDTDALYRSFLRRRAPMAGLKVVPALFRKGTVPRLLETLRYGSEEPRAAAELLSMGVAASMRGQGFGSRLITSLIEWCQSRSIESMKVVVGSENLEAVRLYNRNGFVDGRTIEVHSGEKSEEFIWLA